MTNYEKLVETLRWTANEYKGSIMDEYDKDTMNAAADAIEALQAAEPTEKQVVDYCHKRCLVVLSADLFHELKASYGKLPKRGKWVEDTTTYAGHGLSNYKCSLCGKIGGTWRRGLEPSELPNWCGNCGAKMEVQE